MIRSSRDFALGRILDHRSMVKQVATLLNWDVSELITADSNTANIKPRRPECIVPKLDDEKNGHFYLKVESSPRYLLLLGKHW